MPIYEYHCDNCGANHDQRLPIGGAPYRRCPSCGAMARRVFSASGLVFKGSGFYSTDSKKREGDQ